MSELPENLKTLAPDVYWDEKRGSIYLRQRGGSCPDVPGLIDRLRQVLNETPDNTAIRYVMAGFLLRSGRRLEAQAELELAAQSGDVVWSAKAQQVLDMGFKP